MPRPLRIHVPGAFYHVTLRGNHRQSIFFAARDREIMSSIVAEVVERFEARLHVYCYMTNHVHALIQVGDAPLGRLMLRIAGRYARTIQKGLRTTGHLFEKRYYPVLVDADEYLLELLRYIHRNPVRARIVESVDDYPWSSHHAYVGARDEPFVHTDFALRLFANVGAGSCIRAFRMRRAKTRVHERRHHFPSRHSRFHTSTE
jgi:putative transposase